MQNLHFAAPRAARSQHMTTFGARTERPCPRQLVKRCPEGTGALFTSRPINAGSADPVGLCLARTVGPPESLGCHCVQPAPQPGTASPDAQACEQEFWALFSTDVTVILKHVLLETTRPGQRRGRSQTQRRASAFCSQTNPATFTL